ncbi:MAG: hypothetical protein H7X88_01805 [Gloeobacteraceae cyanobacterium ES-bin-316]|nr:hypothetical protein [Ferruginibacter sp.]
MNKIDNPVGYIFSQSQGNLLSAFQEVKEIMPNETYWQTLGEVWNRTTVIRKYHQQWKELLTAPREHAQLFMTKQERKVFYRLPSIVTVYQIHDPLKNHHDCFSYNIDENQVRSMAQGTKLIKIRVPVQKIFAYVNYQNRNEIIIL